jgi:hypothetical protein
MGYLLANHYQKHQQGLHACRMFRKLANCGYWQGDFAKMVLYEIEGKKKEAIELYRQQSQPSLSLYMYDWYYACRRMGLPENEAVARIEQYKAQHFPPSGSNRLWYQVTTHEYKMQYKLLDRYYEYIQNTAPGADPQIASAPSGETHDRMNPASILEKTCDHFFHAAKREKSIHQAFDSYLIALRLDDDERRNRIVDILEEALQLIKISRSGFDSPLMPLFFMMEEDADRDSPKGFSRTEIQDYLDRLSPHDRINALCFLGRYHMILGQEEKAIAYWKDAAGMPMFRIVAYLLATTKLREHGWTEEEYRETLEKFKNK